MTEPRTTDPTVAARLGLWDSVSIIVGIVVGATIFKAPAWVFANVEGPGEGLAVWAAGGLLSLCGALCYAELAATYPRVGGDYAWLTSAYGRPIGFLFGWAHLMGILTGSIGVMAFVFADYAIEFAGLDGGEGAVANGRPERAACGFAVAAVLALTVLNGLGVVLGKAAQNLLTLCKIVGLLALVVAGAVWGAGGGGQPASEMSGPGLGLAMIFVLYAYGGWNDAAFVAAEVRDGARNIPRALILGICGITAIYLLVNVAYLRGLGFEGIRNSETPAADVLHLLPFSGAATAMSLLVMFSALGALNGLILTGSRVHAGLGADHRLFAWLGRWNQRLGTPVGSLVAQALVSVGLIVAVGTSRGRQAFDAVLVAAGRPPLPWENFGGGFETLVAATAPVFWVFFLLTGVALFVLRFKNRGITRPFSVPLFPLVPIVFCLTCGYMLWSSLKYAQDLALLALVPLGFGVPLYFVSQWVGRKLRVEG